MELLDKLWNSPNVVLWIAPFLFAIAILFDNDFIGSGAYKKRFDGVTISTLFGGTLPLILLAPSTDYRLLLDTPATVIAISIVGGILYIAHLFFYFDVLFTHDNRGKPLNDGSVVELFINLNVLFVPLCAWVLFDDALTQIQWLGVVVIVIAAIMMSGIKGARSTLLSGLICAAMLAAYYLSEEYVYETLSLREGFFVFSAVLTLSGIVMIISRRTRPSASVMRVGNLVKFSIAELVTILAVLASQQALKLNPVVFVVAVESFTPVFVVFLSLVPTWFLLFRSARQRESAVELLLVNSSTTDYLRVFATQRENLAIKGFSTLVMVIGTVFLLR